MKKVMQKRIKASKQKATELVRYANPKSKNKPSITRIQEILSANIPYVGERPTIVNVSVIDYSKNDIIKSAHFKVATSNNKIFKISAYEHLTPQSAEQKEIDKTATFPSGLFNIFHSEIN